MKLWSIFFTGIRETNEQGTSTTTRMGKEVQRTTWTFGFVKQYGMKANVL